MRNNNITEDYYNYINNNYNQPIYNQTTTPNKLYDPYNGFVRGNMFPDLYNGYKLKEPIDIEPMNEQARLLTYIDALKFAMTDLDLYLDIYPNDKEIINLYNQYRLQANEFVKNYENNYGPLALNSEALKAYPWKWISSPWPWEN